MAELYKERETKWMMDPRGLEEEIRFGGGPGAGGGGMDGRGMREESGYEF